MPKLEELEPEEDLERLEPFEEAVVVRDIEGEKMEEGLYMFPAPPRPAGV